MDFLVSPLSSVAENAKHLLFYARHMGLNQRLTSEALAAIAGWNDINPIDAN
tara:strand:- start:19380 stop:19535 length:156 start_codon:yes stop_codon:yes gene_type:complete